MRPISQQETESRRKISVSQALYLRLAAASDRHHLNVIRVIEDALIDALLKIEARETTGGTQ